MLRRSSTALLRNTVARSKCRCRCPQSQQSRRLNLLHELFVKPPFPISAKNQANLDACQPKDLSSPINITLNLVSATTAHPERLTLSETIDRLQPLHHLSLPSHHVPHSDDLPSSAQSKKLYPPNRTYQIKPLKVLEDFIPKILPDRWDDHGIRTRSGRLVKRRDFPHAGRGRQIHFTGTSPPSHLASLLARAYCALLQGCRLEFHLHQRTKDKQVENYLDRTLQCCLHLRPDVIMKAMPQGTELLVLPAVYKSRDLEELVWALELPEALAKAGVRTPGYIKKRARWGLPKAESDVVEAV